MTTGTDTLDKIQAALIAAGAGQNESSSEDWMIYKGAMQDAENGSTAVVDQAICLYETGGMPPLEAWQVDYPGVQIMVRSKPDGYTAARLQLQMIFDALHSQEANISPDFVYFNATHSAPVSMGYDERRRWRGVWNFRSMRNRPTD
jgi:hypothetical protein